MHCCRCSASSTHLHRGEQGTPASLHSQYFFRQRDFRQRQPFLCSVSPPTLHSTCGQRKIFHLSNDVVGCSSVPTSGSLACVQSTVGICKNAFTKVSTHIITSRAVCRRFLWRMLRFFVIWYKRSGVETCPSQKSQPSLEVQRHQKGKLSR